jgi:N-methylhydantoinase B
MAHAMELVESHECIDSDMLILNDPYKGGTTLPDITLVAPVLPVMTWSAFVRHRAHHADIGSDAPAPCPLAGHYEEGTPHTTDPVDENGR